MMPEARGRSGPKPSLYELEPLELAAGWVFGNGDEPPEVGIRGSPRDELEVLLLDALQRSPCVVAFSGGRDSSALLATAVDIARRHGLPDPIAVTRRYSDHPDAHETEWQTMVIRHLEVEDWICIEMDDRCDLIGTYARPVLLGHGLVWPFAAYTNLPMFEVARGGAVLTGEGGDSVFGAHRAAVARHLTSGSARQRVRAARLLPALAGPKAVRRRLVRRTLERDDASTWLRPDARAEILDRLASDEVDQPWRWGKAVRRHPMRRSWRAGCLTIEVLANEYDVTVSHPLFDHRFLAAVASAVHRHGPMSRAEVMTGLFGDLLPASTLSRNTKAAFNTTVVGSASREFIDAWHGDGVDPMLVSPEALQREWRSPRPHAASFGLLQAAWLDSRDDRNTA